MARPAVVKQVFRDLEREQAAHRQALADNERLRSLLEVGGPLRSLAKAYADLLLASHPLQGRTLDAHRVGEFDRPLPFEATSRLRAVQESADRLMRNMTSAIVDALGDPADVSLRMRDLCGECGQSIEDRGRRSAVAEAREFVTRVLAGGPVEATTVTRTARREGISERTLDRCLRGRGAPVVMKFQRDGKWWWDLQEVAGG